MNGSCSLCGADLSKAELHNAVIHGDRDALCWKCSDASPDRDEITLIEKVIGWLTGIAIVLTFIALMMANRGAQ